MFKDESVVPFWDGTERIDGVKIVYSQRQSRWEIVPVEGDRVTLCPCCAKVFQMPRAAKLVANEVFPLIEAEQGLKHHE